MPEAKVCGAGCMVIKKTPLYKAVSFIFSLFFPALPKAEFKSSQFSVVGQPVGLQPGRPTLKPLQSQEAHRVTSSQSLSVRDKLQDKNATDGYFKPKFTSY